jgi:putative methyltransferase (TIGR04325 family)
MAAHSSNDRHQLALPRGSDGAKLWRRWAKRVVPARVRLWLRRCQRRWVGWRWFRGHYATWEKAKAAAEGYDDPAILARVVAATRAVRAGAASWERDGTLFTEPAAHESLLKVLREIAEAEGGELDVVDFGGALGSTWWQHRGWLQDLHTVRWRVIEQPGFVSAGRAEFCNDTLSFHYSLEEAGRPVVLLLSGVLQFLEEPHSFLTDAASRGFRHIIIDRTPFSLGSGDQIRVQHTPPALGGGSYPSWIFEATRLFSSLGEGYELVSSWAVEFDLLDGGPEFRGAYFKSRESSSN